MEQERKDAAAADRCGAYIYQILAELVGTFILTFISCGAFQVSGILENDAVSMSRTLYVGLAYGMTYGGVVYSLSFDVNNPNAPLLKTSICTKCRTKAGAGKFCTNCGHKLVSRASLPPNYRQLNPALSLCLVVIGRVTFIDFVLHVLAQFAGGGLVMLLLPFANPVSKAAPYPLEKIENVTMVQELFMGGISTLIFIMVICMTYFDGSKTRIKSEYESADAVKPQTQHEINCIITASVIVACTCVCSPVTGEYMNPVFALVLSNLTKSWQLVPFLSPLVGSGLAAFFCFICDFQLKWVESVHGKPLKKITYVAKSLQPVSRLPGADGEAGTVNEMGVRS